ncbi:MAG TPA: hypothetical protein VNK52_14365 [Hyphomicrobiaceae bacterium]|nr:hypothetical protein [Hyphomicrobiaceae bacterium]
MRVLLASLAALAFGSQIAIAGDVYVQGYMRKDGTYVQPHYRSAPDGNLWNNYSTQGNVNPYTGRSGSVEPYSNIYGGSNFNYGSTYGGSGLYGTRRRY